MNSFVQKKDKVVDFVSSDESSQSDSDSEAIVSKVKKTSYKSKIKPPKDAFKTIPKVNKPQRRPTPKKKRPGNSKKPSTPMKPPAPPKNSKKSPAAAPPKRKRPTHNYTEEDAKKALDEYYET